MMSARIRRAAADTSLLMKICVCIVDWFLVWRGLGGVSSEIQKLSSSVGYAKDKYLNPLPTLFPFPMGDVSLS